MHLDRYDCQTTDDTGSFTFESVGPKGVIKKIISYQPLPLQIIGIQVINLAFGDWNEVTQQMDDLAVSNNNDRNKVLATVAYTVLNYLEKNGQVAIYAAGVTPAKTRLYQMGLNAHRTEIERLFWLFGLQGDNWYPFQHGFNYEAFLILRK